MAVCDAYEKGMSFFTTVTDNMKMFTQCQIQCAKDARRAYDMVGNPSPKDIKNIVRGHSIKNCPITSEDIVIADITFGPDVAS